MTDPERADRLWLVMAVATRYVLALGGEAESAEIAIETIPEMVPAEPESRASRRRITSADPQAPARRPIKIAASHIATAPRTSVGDQAAIGQRLSSRIGRVGQRSDRRSCVTETSVVSGAVARNQG